MIDHAPGAVNCSNGKRTLLLTGSSGFLGNALLHYFSELSDLSIVVASRSSHEVPVGVRHEVVGEIDGETCWAAAFKQPVDIVVHAAARAHVMHETAVEPEQEYRRINAAGTLNLARCAAGAGAKRFIFISSIKVNAETSLPGRPLRPDDPPQPVDAYGVSKLEAENGLWELQRTTGMEVVVIRPVLIYGPGVKANFRAMMKWLDRRVPLPLGAIHNTRSLLALDNAVDFVGLCLHHPCAANETFLLSDGQDISTTVLLRRLSQGLGKLPLLVPVPGRLLLSVAAVVGLRSKAQRLLGSLQVDIEKNFRLLGWRPPVDRDVALEAVARSYRVSRCK